MCFVENLNLCPLLVREFLKTPESCNKKQQYKMKEILVENYDNASSEKFEQFKTTICNTTSVNKQDSSIVEIAKRI